MKIGKPGVPSEWKQGGVYAEIWNRVGRLPEGKWLPVTFKTSTDALKLYRAAKYQRFQACVRKTTTWITKNKQTRKDRP